MKTLDFNVVKKNYWTIILPDEEQTKVDIMTPSKTVVEEMSEILDILQTSQDEVAMSATYDFVAKCMSRNKQKVTITGEQLAPLLDFEDLCIFLDTYTDFIEEQKAANAKN